LRKAALKLLLLTIVFLQFTFKTLYSVITFAIDIWLVAIEYWILQLNIALKCLILTFDYLHKTILVHNCYSGFGPVGTECARGAHPTAVYTWHKCTLNRGAHPTVVHTQKQWVTISLLTKSEGGSRVKMTRKLRGMHYRRWW